MDKLNLMAAIIFLLSLLPLAFARELWLRENVVGGYMERERIQGRFTGAKKHILILKNGREIEPMFSTFVVVANIFLVPILIVGILLR